MKWLRILLAPLLLACPGCLIGCGVEGIHSANPRTIIRAGGFGFENGKDVSLNLEKGTFDPTTKAFELNNLKIEDNASEVRRANVEQIDALARESYAIGQAWSMGLTAGAQFAAQLMPGIASWAPRPPWGSGQAGVTPPGWFYYGDQAGQPTSRPATDAAPCPTCGVDIARLQADWQARLDRLRAELLDRAKPGTTD